MPARPILNGGVLTPAGVDEYVLTAPCTITGKPHSVRLPGAGIALYRTGVDVQHAFPALSDDDREFLISGTSPEGWRMIFPNGGDE